MRLTSRIRGAYHVHHLKRLLRQRQAGQRRAAALLADAELRWWQDALRNLTPKEH